MTLYISVSFISVLEFCSWTISGEKVDLGHHYFVIDYSPRPVLSVQGVIANTGSLVHLLAGVPAAGDHPEPVHRVGPRGPGARWLCRHRPAEDQQGAGEAAGVGRRVGLLRFAQQHRSGERLRGQSQRLPAGRGAAGGPPAAAERLQRRQVPLASCQSEQYGCLAFNPAPGQSESH